MHPKRIYIGHQAMLLRNHEKQLYSDVDVCFAITEKDKASALKLAPTANVVVAGPGVNADEWDPDPEVKRNPQEMILATTYKWVHNVDALKWFLDNVLPIVREKIPGAYLTLLGKEPPEWLESYKSKGLNLVGYVPEVQPYLNRAGIYIAPLFVGAGIRIKILEAMAMQLPVVATPVSAEGIKAGEKEGLFISARPEEFAARIIRLMTDEPMRAAAGISARRYVLENFSWERNVRIMLDEYGKLV
jgi:glycosyltransferase involved in cell wall biosynthesis